MDEQQDRIIPVLAADLDPLPDAADVDESGLLHPIRGMDRKDARRNMLAVGTKTQTDAHQRHQQRGRTEESKRYAFGDPARHRRPAVVHKDVS